MYVKFDDLTQEQKQQIARAWFAHYDVEFTQSAQPLSFWVEDGRVDVKRRPVRWMMPDTNAMLNVRDTDHGQPQRTEEGDIIFA